MFELIHFLCIFTNNFVTCGVISKIFFYFEGSMTRGSYGYRVNTRIVITLFCVFIGFSVNCGTVKQVYVIYKDTQLRSNL